MQLGVCGMISSDVVWLLAFLRSLAHAFFMLVTVLEQRCLFVVEQSLTSISHVEVKCPSESHCCWQAARSRLCFLLAEKGGAIHHLLRRLMLQQVLSKSGVPRNSGHHPHTARPDIFRVSFFVCCFFLVFIGYCVFHVSHLCWKSGAFLSLSNL
jgi:hypothetical protein